MFWPNKAADLMLQEMLVSAICKASRASVIPCRLTRQRISTLEYLFWATWLPAIASSPPTRTVSVAIAKKPIK